MNAPNKQPTGYAIAAHLLELSEHAPAHTAGHTSHAALIEEIAAQAQLIARDTATIANLRAALKLCVARLDEYEDAKDGIALECANLELERTAPTARAALERSA